MEEKQKVLIVDDEPRNQRILFETLEDLVELKAASSGEEALSLIEEFQPDLILLDIMLPGVDGYEVCKAVRANGKTSFTKVLLISGKAMIDERLKGYEVGADDYMTKPFVSEELLAKVKVFLRLTLVERHLNDLNIRLDEKVHEKTQQLLESEAKLISAAKMSALGEMAGGIAHEINTPLGTIALISSQIREFLSEDPINREAVTGLTIVVDETVERIDKIIRGLRSFSRDGGQDPVQSISVKHVLEETMNLCREKIKQSRVQLMETPIPDDLLVLCRPVQLSQVLLNLIGNACDAVENVENKWIQLEAEREGSSIRISITDSGGGIPPGTQEKMFQPFFTTKEIGKGTGLGLSISKGIIEAHHGSLNIDNQCKNTRFIVLLPAGAPVHVKAA